MNGGLTIANEVRIEARPWEPQDLIDDLQLMIDEEPDSYLNGNRITLCMARDYLKKFFSEESLRPKGRWVYDQYNMEWACSECFEAAHVGIGETCGYILSDYCPNCGAKMEG